MAFLKPEKENEWYIGFFILSFVFSLVSIIVESQELIKGALYSATAIMAILSIIYTFIKKKKE